ncbi:hypothetical protein BH23CHL8_BH23CHL8_21540 [soil metagenome]
MRRPISTIITFLAALALALAAMAPGVAAQDDPMSTLDHPIVGSWIVDAGDDDPSLEFAVFGPGGTVLQASVDGVAVGAWTPTDERTVDLTFLGRAPGPVVGSFTIRGSLEVSEDGSSFTGTYTFEPSPEIAGNFGLEPGEMGPGDVTGERIAAEPMGEVIGPMPDFGQAPPEDQGASPPPGASPAVEEMPPVEGSPAPEASPAG